MEDQLPDHAHQHDWMKNYLGTNLDILTTLYSRFFPKYIAVSFFYPGVIQIISFVPLTLQDWCEHEIIDANILQELNALF